MRGPLSKLGSLKRALDPLERGLEAGVVRARWPVLAAAVGGGRDDPEVFPAHERVTAAEELMRGCLDLVCGLLDRGRVSAVS
jgi:hypothetical protein